MTSYTQRAKTLAARGIHICKCHYTEIAWFINSSQLFEKALHFCPRQVVASSKLSSLLWRLRQRLMNGLGVNYDERGGHRGCCSYVFMYPIMDAVWTISYWIENSLVTIHYMYIHILLLSLHCWITFYSVYSCEYRLITYVYCLWFLEIFLMIMLCINFWTNL